jgi:hypothetical protein
MSLFSKRKDLAVHSLVLKLVNTHCPKLTAMLDGPRQDSRVNLTVVALVIPIDGKQIQLPRAFTAVTKEFSNDGVSLVLNEPIGLDWAILGFRQEGQMEFVRAQVKHLDPMGGGFYQLGLQMTEVVSPADYPELKSLARISHHTYREGRPFVA